MKKIIWLSMLLWALPAQANSLMDWIPDVKHTQSVSEQENDSAQLVTLEPKESELYPRVSPDGKSLLVVAHEQKRSWISRRAVENGDPLNVVTEDPAAMTSFHWYGDEVTFLSQRTGSLALWRKPADGEGLMHRSMQMTPPLLDVTLLSDGSAIGVRLVEDLAVKKHLKQTHSDLFMNWEVPGYHAYIVRIHQDGTETRLSQGVNPAVSPDEKQLVYSMAVGRSIHLFLLNLDNPNGEIAELTDGRSVDVQASWSPDGQTIVFASNRSQADLRGNKKSQWDIWKVSSEGKDLTQVTLDPARDGAPSMAANGDIYFHSDRKIEKADKRERQVSSSVGKFHIWKVVAGVPSLN